MTIKSLSGQRLSDASHSAMRASSCSARCSTAKDCSVNAARLSAAHCRKSCASSMNVLGIFGLLSSSLIGNVWRVNQQLPLFPHVAVDAALLLAVPRMARDCAYAIHPHAPSMPAKLAPDWDLLAHGTH